MIKFKRVVLSTLILSCASFVMAQTSNTSKSTAGVFGNDTDSFMDVNSWSDVAPQNFFGTLGYSNGHLNLGAAKNIGNFYFGTYLDGNLGFNFNNQKKQQEFSSESTETNTASLNSENRKSNIFSEGNIFNERTSDFDISLLMGIGKNLGIKAGFAYKGDSNTLKYEYEKEESNTTTIKTTTTNTTTNSTSESESENVKQQSITPAIEVGYNVGVGNVFLKNRGYFSVDIEQNYEKTYDSTLAAQTPERNDTISTFNFGAGTTVVFPEKNNISQELSGLLSFSFYNKNNNSNKTENNSIKNYTIDITTTDIAIKKSGTSLNFYPSYKVSYNKIERLKLGAKISCPISAKFDRIETKTNIYKEFEQKETYTYTGLEENENTVNKVYDNRLSFTPALNLGLQYQAIPEKLTINVGARVSSPTLKASFTGDKTDITNKTTSYTDKTSKNYTNENKTSSENTKSSTWTGADATGTLSLSTGFTYRLAKTVDFDCSYNILGDLFTPTLNSNWATGSSTSIWDNLNLILFHSLNLQVSVKL